MMVTLSGIITEVKPAQFLKVDAPIVVTLLETTSCFISSPFR